MFGAITGDVIGSVYEHRNVKHKAFLLFDAASRFTDDTVLTLAVAQALLEGEAPGVAMRGAARALPGGRLLAPPSAPDRGWRTRFRRRRARATAQPCASARWPAPTTPRCGVPPPSASPVTHTTVGRTRPPPRRCSLARRRGAAIRADRGAFGYDLRCRSTRCAPATPSTFLCRHRAVGDPRVSRGRSTSEDAVRNAVSLGGDSDTPPASPAPSPRRIWGGVPPAIAQAVWRGRCAAGGVLARRFWCRLRGAVTASAPSAPA